MKLVFHVNFMRDTGDKTSQAQGGRETKFLRQIFPQISQIKIQIQTKLSFAQKRMFQTDFIK